jgi:amino acid adenylation domain-containing protein
MPFRNTLSSMPSAAESTLDLQWATIVDVLRHRAAVQPRAVAFTFLSDGEAAESNLTFADLDRKARAMAVSLQEDGMQGERALLLLPSGLDYIVSFFGCLYAGVAPVPSFPVHFGRLRREHSWFHGIVADSGSCLAFATPELIARAEKEAAQEPTIQKLRWVNPGAIQEAQADRWNFPEPDRNSLAFLQYTSGSTSTPRGVMVSHGNIMANQAVIRAACGTDHESTIVSWLPLYHDMGLIGTVLQALYLGARLVFMSPARFLRNPALWLQAISTYRGHSSTGPNFAYELCLRKISQEQKSGLDLKRWKIAVNGAEPVRPETMERFAEAFAECGFDRRAFLPSYGLAESTLMVTGARSGSLPETMRVSARGLEQNVAREPVAGESVRWLAGCGAGDRSQQVRIVNPETFELCPERTIGETWTSGPSVTQGYWNKPEETEYFFRARLKNEGDAFFLRTGDLGFLAEDQLFITGRLKDLIILRGRNLYPQDIELTAQNCDPSMQPGGGAAFVVEVEKEDALVVVQEVQRQQGSDLEKLLAAVREAVLIDHGIQAHAIALVRSGAIPKTTSGKIRRRHCKELYLHGQLETLASKTYSPATGEGEASLPGLSRMELLEMQPNLRQSVAESYLRTRIASMLKARAEEIPVEQPLPGLGIDSVLAVELAGIVENLSGARFDPVEILKGCTLEELATAVCQQVSSREERSKPEQREPGEAAHPLSLGQRGLWILYQAAPQSTVYTLSGAVRTRQLDVDRLRSAFAEVVARHPMLRTTFGMQAQEPAQFVQRMEDFSLDRHFQCIETPSLEPGALKGLLKEESTRPFALEKEPSVRLKVFFDGSGDHVLLLALHHIIADMWSIAIVLRDLGALYSTGAANGALARESPSYFDFVQWQARKLKSAEGEALQKFWLDELKGELPVLQMPTDRVRPPMQSYLGSSEALRIAPQVSDMLKQIGRGENATRFVIFLAAFQLLLHRISGQGEVLLGSPTTGRTQPEFFDVVGYCVNPVVLRSRYDSQMNFLAFLKSSRTTALRALENQDYPFPLLVEKLHAERIPGASPVFQAMFVWQQAYGSQAEALAPLTLGGKGIHLRLGDLSFESVELENTGSQFDLTLLMAENGGETLGVFKYNTSLFDPATIRNLANCFFALLQEIALEPQRPVSTLPLLGKAEREQLISEWRSLEADAPGSRPRIHEIFEEEARRHPEQTALVVGERQLTYAQLNARANQFARHLRTLGVRSEVTVGLCLERTVELIVALLGTWKAGGAYVPFDAHDPKDRLSWLMQEASIGVLVTHESLLEHLPEQLPTLVLLDLDLDVIALESEEDLNANVPLESLGYLIYTSGSTGNPKAAMIEHRSLLNLRQGLKRAIYDQREPGPMRVGLNAPLAFDSSIKQLLALTLGHTLFLAPESFRRNGEALLSWIRESRLDLMDCTPTQLRLLIEAGFSDAERVALLIGGEPVPEEVWSRIAGHKSTLSYNVYGPTECTVDATACAVGPESLPSIGRSLWGTKVYVLDENLQPAAAGAVGEMFIGGRSVGRGYFGRPELTAEKFLPDPFIGESGARMYRTGDRARFSVDRKIQFIGRTDRQVKIRGFRIELGEIETALRQCAGVQDAAVVVRSRSNGQKQLIGYVAANTLHHSNEYRQLLAKKLPEYMAPTVVVTVPRIPTNAHGKRDYTALPAVDTAAAEPGLDYVPPQTALEKELAQLWSDALLVQPIGVEDNFFALGGDSLQATRLIARIQEKYPTHTALLAPFFQEPTIKALAQLILAPQDGGIPR